MSTSTQQDQPKVPSRLSDVELENMPRVIIVGAGLGGLFLAIILEHIGIDYYIHERASTIKPLGNSSPPPPPLQKKEAKPLLTNIQQQQAQEETKYSLK